ncbi:MAG: hypothetical protein II045_06510, partial [Oscillospiraceae bacterium]|nr:hypothetical protein [Oscillospiraceae bacterium]
MTLSGQFAYCRNAGQGHFLLQERMICMQHWKWMLAAGLVASAACWQAGSASAATAAATATAATAPAANTNNAAISLNFDASKYTEEHMDCEG